MASKQLLKTKVVNILTDNPGNYYVTCSDKERVRFRKWVTGVLRDGEVTVDFEKADGSERSMRCTLEESYLPTSNHTTAKKRDNEDVCVVWDCNQQAWRSFRWDRLKRISFTIG